jgi:hypothetical protein
MLIVSLILVIYGKGESLVWLTCITKQMKCSNHAVNMCWIHNSKGHCRIQQFVDYVFAFLLLKIHGNPKGKTI